jgi:hypothetical protein
MPSRIPFANARIKNWHSRLCHLLNFSICTNYLHYKTLYRDTQKGRPIFYAYPDALQMVFDEIISSGRDSHLQGRTFYNGTLYNFCNWTASMLLQRCLLNKIQFRLTIYSHLPGLLDYRQTF